MTTKKPEYDRYAKQLWVKVYQEELTRSHDNEEAKDTADLAMADYMNSIHKQTPVVKENLTTEKDYEDGWNEWNDCKAKYTSTKNIIEERDNYYNELQKLRQENADLGAENKRLKEQNENLDVAYMAGVIDGSKKQSVDTTNMIEVPFELDQDGDVIILLQDSHKTRQLYAYCEDQYIDQKRIKRILLEMKSEDE